MERSIRIASINHNESSIPNSPHYGKRIKLELRKDEDAYRWYTSEGEDTEVSGATVVIACHEAEDAWGRNTRGTPFDVWKFRASWS